MAKETKSKSTQSTPVHSTAGGTRGLQRAKATRQPRNQNLLIVGGAAIFGLLIALVVYLNIRSQRPVAGEEVFSSQGNTHIATDSPSPLAYNSTPPTSGPHYDNVVAWNTFREPQRYEHLLHNLEDGGVIVYYQCSEDCPEIVTGLNEVVEPYIKAGRKVILVPNDPAWTIGSSQPLHQEMATRIAVTAWQRLLTMDEVDSQQIRTFIERYEGVDHHA